MSLLPFRCLSLTTLLGLSTLSACTPAALVGQSVQVPTFQTQSIALTGIGLPSSDQSGWADLHLQLQVDNPNPFTVRLHSFDTDLYLTGQPVAAIHLPNLNLPAGGQTLQTANVRLPLNLAAAGEVLKVARGQAVTYRIDGTFSADLEPLGQPHFGPLTLAQGQWKQPAILPF
ncbi:LEA type 2 family protein [Deinococcus radiophilus]|uniref:LEA type 2 family protein n=1 Tax=Deinococcus radiophilus TaxID=32062 RepID=UPI001E4300C0|nr:LEA type 2 family protein [Deinococcus radiophilus]UFA49425.1 LEA type 2 family protein [Deinococcus radiophilus]